MDPGCDQAASCLATAAMMWHRLLRLSGRAMTAAVLPDPMLLNLPAMLAKTVGQNEWKVAK